MLYIYWKKQKSELLALPIEEKEAHWRWTKSKTSRDRGTVESVDSGAALTKSEGSKKFDSDQSTPIVRWRRTVHS